MHEECCGKQSLPRRRLLQGGVAAAAVGALGTAAAAGPESAAAAPAGGARAIDIHAHYFPQPYLDILGEEGKRYGFGYRTSPAGFFVGPAGPLPAKFTDLDRRLAEMDAQGVRMHALSLTAPMLYFGGPDLSHRLARAWNDAASAAHQA